MPRVGGQAKRSVEGQANDKRSGEAKQQHTERPDASLLWAYVCGCHNITMSPRTACKTKSRVYLTKRSFPQSQAGRQRRKK